MLSLFTGYGGLGGARGLGIGAGGAGGIAEGREVYEEG